MRLPLPEAIARARAGGIAEGQTALTILLAADRLASHAEGEAHERGSREGRRSRRLSPTQTVRPLS